MKRNYHQKSYQTYNYSNYYTNNKYYQNNFGNYNNYYYNDEYESNNYNNYYYSKYKNSKNQNFNKFNKNIYTKNKHQNYNDGYYQYNDQNNYYESYNNRYKNNNYYNNNSNNIYSNNNYNYYKKDINYKNNNYNYNIIDNYNNNKSNINKKTKKEKVKKNSYNNNNKNNKNIIEINIQEKSNIQKKKLEFPEYDEIQKNFLLFYNIVKAPIESLIGSKENLNNYDEIINNLRKKIFEIFKIDEIKEEKLYEKIIKFFEEVRDENKNVKISPKFLNYIIFFINNKVISINENENIKKIALDFLLNNISNIIAELLEKYIIFFQIKEILVKHFDSKQKILNLKKSSIHIVKLLNLQDNLSFEEFEIIDEKKHIDFTLINQLFHTYNRTEKELFDLYQFISSKIPKKSIPLINFKSIFSDNNFTEDFKKILLDNLLKYPEEKDDNNYNSLYLFIYKNKLDKYFPESKDEKFLNNLIFNLKFNNTALTILKHYDKEKIKSLDKSLLKQLLNSIDKIDNNSINSILFLLEYIPEELNAILKNIYNLKRKIVNKFLKKINIKEISNNEILIKMENQKVFNFYYFKVIKYLHTHLDLILEHINNQKEFETFFQIIKKKIKAVWMKKLSYILNFAKNKGFIIPYIGNRKKRELIQKAQNNKNMIIFSDDKFGPRTEDCLSYSKEEINIIFIQNCKDLIKNYELYFEKSKFIGIDSEWRESLELFGKTQTSIIQLSDYNGKNIFILDIIELNKEENFKDIFEKLFILKTFISFGFNSDLENLPENLRIFFEEKAKIIDIINLYKIKYFEECPAFSKVCDRIIGKKLCKCEQCSNWERRPLREAQLHYAALDAILCCLIFKKLTEKNKF